MWLTCVGNSDAVVDSDHPMGRQRVLENEVKWRMKNMTDMLGMSGLHHSMVTTR